MENADPAVLLTECPQRDDSQVPAAMVADEHQFGHWAECLGMADLATGKIAAAHVSIITAYNPRASSLKPLYTPHAEALVALYRMRTEHAEHLDRASITPRRDPGCSTWTSQEAISAPPGARGDPGESPLRWSALCLPPLWWVCVSASWPSSPDTPHARRRPAVEAPESVGGVPTGAPVPPRDLP